MKYILFLSLIIPFLITAQDTTYVVIEDTNVYLHESERNYLGINLSPMVAGLLTNQNEHNSMIACVALVLYVFQSMLILFDAR